MAAKKTSPSKEDLVTDFKNVETTYRKQFPNTNLTRDYYREHGKYSDAEISKVYGSFSTLKNEAHKTDEVEFVDEIEPPKVTRQDLNIVKDYSKKSKNTRYFVTSAIAGGSLNKAFFKSIKTYCKYNDAKLVILPMRGVSVKDDFFDEEILVYSDYFSTEFIFSDTLKAMDFMINPQMINPLTSLSRYGSCQSSLIVASPKQQMVCVPVSSRTIPHIMQSTGTITKPKYADTRQGRLAEQDHCTGGLIIEIKDNTQFFIRQVQADKANGFYDIDKYYLSNTVRKGIKAEAFIMGDLHSGSEDPNVIKAWKECIEVTKPKYVIMHDIFDSMSINHHEENNVIFNAKLPEYARTLENELNLLGNTLQEWGTSFPETTFVITRGNHDLWLDGYLKYGKYAQAGQSHNHRLSLDLAKFVIDGKNPIEEYLNLNFDIKNIKWLDVDDDFIIEGCQVGFHGHIGSGSRYAPSLYTLELNYANSFSGHKHSPSVLRKTWVVGTSTLLDLEYNKGGGSSWLHSSGLLFKGGMKQIVSTYKDCWKL